MAQIIWNHSANLDLKDIYDHIATDSKKYATITVVNIRNAVKILKTQPLAGKVVEEFNKESIRELVYSDYRIIYRLKTDDLIQILLIHHGARDLPKRKLKF